MSSNECIICGKNCVEDDSGDGHLEIGSAVHFSATGNWASGVWDPLDEHLSLNIFICDECLKERKSRATVIRHDYKGWEETYRKQFDKWEPRRHDDRWTFKCTCGGEMIIENVGLDELPICVKCKRRGPKIVKTRDDRKGFKQ